MKINYNTNPNILNEFLNYLKILNYSIKTIEAYCSDLLIFFKFYKLYKNIDTDIQFFNVSILSKVTPSDILSFLVYLAQNFDNNPYTRQRRLSCIRKFYNWLFNQYPGCIKDNPTKDIPNIEKTIRLPKYLTLEQSKKIVKIFTLKNSMYPLRNNTIIFLFLNTGLRVSELVKLNIKDVDLKEKYIKIVGKANKERIVFINEATKKELLKYINSRFKGKAINIDEPLFINNRNKRLGVDGVENICKKAYKLMGLEENRYTTHTLRHTAAILIYQYVKSDILLLKYILGHKNISSTEIYTHIFDEKIKKAFENNPLSNYKVA